MDPPDAMTDPIGPVQGRSGANAVVNLRRHAALVTILLYAQKAAIVIERDFAPAEAAELADLLDEAADLVNRPGQVDDDDLHEVGSVTTRDARWDVRAQWPTV